MAENPVARGLFVCEQVIVEERTRNVSLVNCFARKVVAEVPFTPQQMVVFALLTNGQGTMPIELRASRLQDDAVLFAQVQPVTFTDPLAEFRFVYRFSRLTFPAAGWYEFSLVTPGGVIAQSRIEIRVRG